jgi:hypothetical protein
VPAEADPTEAQDLQRSALQLLVEEVVARHGTDPGFRAFYRTAVDGLPAVAVAEELGLGAEAVRQHKSRWVKRLRDRLAERFGGLLG